MTVEEKRKPFAADRSGPDDLSGAHLGMLLYTVIIAGSFPVVAAITGELDSTVLTFWRFLSATAVFGIMLPFIRGASKRPSIDDIGRYGVVGGSYGLFFILMFEALKTTSPLNTSTIFTTLPLLTLFIGRFLGEKTRAKQVAVLALSTVAALWVVFRGDWNKLTRLQFSEGDPIFFLGTVCLALYVVSLKKLHRDGESKVRFTFYSLLAATVLLFASSMLRFGSIPVPSPRVWAGLGYLAVLSTAVTFWLAQHAAVRLGPNRVAAYTFLTPSAVAALQWMLGLSTVEPVVLPGIALTLLAVWLLQRD